MQHDVIIIGAGPAGLCLAKAVCDLGLRVAVVERQPHAALAEPAFDGREIALTHASMRLLRELGIWQFLTEEDCSPLRAARVMECDSRHALQVDPALVGKDRLGMLVPNHRIRQAAWRAVQGLAGLALHDQAQIQSLGTDDACAHVILADGTRLEAPLLVAADSRFSETRRAMGIAADQHDFGRSMFLCRVEHELPNHGEAWEWFGHGQTVALLPLRGHLASTVITLPDAEARRLAALDDAGLARELERRYRNRLGRMCPQGSRHVYPLVGVYARRFVARRFALAGDAAVGMHPVTAHGFNLGLASVERLANMLRDARSRGRDLGSAEGLSRYQRQHRRGTLPLYLATRGIVGLFTRDQAPVHRLREAVLRASGRVTPFRRALAATLADPGPVDRAPWQRLRDGIAALRPGGRPR